MDMVGSGNADQFESMDLLQDLVTASSLSYLDNTSDEGEQSSKMQASPYFTNKLKPLAQVVESKTESGATIFEYSNGNDEATLVVACRGSATPINFSTNLRFRLVPLALGSGDTSENYLVHEGFQVASTGLWELLLQNLTPIVQGNKYSSIVFTGHSLGAANALLCATQYQTYSLEASNFPTLNGVITFGGPRLVNSPLAEHWNDSLFASCKVQNYVHAKDPILRQNGPLWDSLGFGIVGTEIPCEPFEATAYVTAQQRQEYDAKDLPVAWNILDHCNYLGIFVGPRLF